MACSFISGMVEPLWGISCWQGEIRIVDSWPWLVQLLQQLNRVSKTRWLRCYMYVGRLGEFSVSVRCSFILGEALFNIENDSVNVCIIIIRYSSSCNTVLFIILIIDMSGYLTGLLFGGKAWSCLLVEWLGVKEPPLWLPPSKTVVHQR